MITNGINKPPVWFWVVSAIGLLWNLTGVYSYLNSKLNKVAMLEALTQEQRELFEGIPAWATAAFAIAVFSGAIASIGLLIRKKWAYPLFIVSLIAAVLQFINWLFLQNAGEVYGGQAYVMPVLVVIVGVFLIFFSKSARQKGWLG